MLWDTKKSTVEGQYGSCLIQLRWAGHVGRVGCGLGSAMNVSVCCGVSQFESLFLGFLKEDLLIFL